MGGDPAPVVRADVDLTTLTVALVSPMTANDLNRRYNDLLRHVSVRCGARSWIEPYPDYARLIQALRDGEAQVALLDPPGLVQALEEDAPVDVFAMGIHGPDLLTHSMLVAPVSGPVRRLEDTAGLRLALTTTDSLTGSLAPAWMVSQRTGLSLESHFSQVIYAGSPVEALRQVAAGAADVAVCDTLTSQILQPGAELTYHDFRVIAQSPPLPGPALVMRSDLPTDVKARVREAFQNTPPRVILPGLDSLDNRYRSASLSDYVAVREMMEALALHAPVAPAPSSPVETGGTDGAQDESEAEEVGMQEGASWEAEPTEEAPSEG